MGDAALRDRLRTAGLDAATVDPDPFVQFRRWYDDARAAEVMEPEAMVLATAGADGHPTARTVLMRGLDERGVVFYTNLESDKAHDLRANARRGARLPLGRDRSPGSAHRPGRSGPRRRGRPLLRPAPARAGSVRGRRRRAGSCATVPSSTGSSPRPRRGSPMRNHRARPSGAGTSSCPTPWSSGRRARRASTIGSATAAPIRSG